MIRLRKIDIEGFRGARLPIELDFASSCKSVIIYGKNGSGKSTFSDALEWFFYKRVRHLWREDCFEEALRNLNLTEQQNAIVKLRFSDSKLDCEAVLDGKLSGKRSNKDNDFKEYVNASEAERLVLRHADLQEFITKSKGEKKKAIADIIGYEEIVDFRDNLTAAFNKLQNDPEFSAARKTLEANRSRMLSSFKRFVESEDEAYSLGNERLQPFKLGFAISDWNTYEEAAKVLEGRATSQGRGAARIVISTAIGRYSQVKGAIEKAIEQIEEFPKVYEGVLAAKDKVIQLNIEGFLKSGRKILDEGWQQPNTCPFCGGEVDVEHLRQELNSRIDEFKHVREEFEGITKSKMFAVSCLQTAERAVRELIEIGTPSDMDEVFRGELRGISEETITVKDQIEESFAAYRRLPELGTLKARANTVIKLIDSEVERFNQKAKELELSSEEKEALDALEFLKELRHLTQESAKLSRLCKGFQSQITSLSAIRDAFIGVQNSTLQAVLDTLSGDVGQYYRAMHPDEEVDNVKLKVVGEEGVEFRYSFHGKETGPPLKYLSESHVNSLGIALFLAAARHFNKLNQFFILDDVVTSFDSDHRMRLLRLLEDKFNQWQIVILTHESFWFESIQEELTTLGWLAKEIDWDYTTGIHWVVGSMDLRKLIEQKRIAKLPIGNDIRKLLERRLKEICLCLRVRMAFLPNGQNERRMIGELLSELRSTLNAKKCPVRDSPVLARLSTINFLTSTESHDNSKEPSAGDIGVALNDVDALDLLFRCPKCTGLINIKFERAAEKKIYCKCGEMSVEWH